MDAISAGCYSWPHVRAAGPFEPLDDGVVRLRDTSAGAALGVSAHYVQSQDLDQGYTGVCFAEATLRVENNEMGTPVRTTLTSATTPATAKKPVPLEDAGKMPQCCLGGKRMDESGRYLLEEGRRDVPIVFANCISGKTYREAIGWCQQIQGWRQHQDCYCPHITATTAAVLQY